VRNLEAYTNDRLVVAPDVPLDDAQEYVPITVMLTPGQAVRFEVLLACMRCTERDFDDNDVADALFDTGLVAFETMFSILEPSA
jgi:hypothetical protein